MDTSKWILMILIIVSFTNEHICSTIQLPQFKRLKRGSHTGQTQSQYLSFGESEDGKAEAETTKTGSRATVYGKSGMGQAQSQTMGTFDCSDDCAEDSARGKSNARDNLRQPGSDGGSDNSRKPGGKSSVYDSRRPGFPNSFEGNSHSPRIDGLPDYDTRRPNMHDRDVMRQPGGFNTDRYRPGSDKASDNGPRRPGGSNNSRRPDMNGSTESNSERHENVGASANDFNSPAGLPGDDFKRPEVGSSYDRDSHQARGSGLSDDDYSRPKGHEKDGSRRPGSYDEDSRRPGSTSGSASDNGKRRPETLDIDKNARRQDGNGFSDHSKSPAGLPGDDFKRPEVGSSYDRDSHQTRGSGSSDYDVRRPNGHDKDGLQRPGGYDEDSRRSGPSGSTSDDGTRRTLDNDKNARRQDVNGLSDSRTIKSENVGSSDKDSKRPEGFVSHSLRHPSGSIYDSKEPEIGSSFGRNSPGGVGSSIHNIRRSKGHDNGALQPGRLDIDARRPEIGSSFGTDSPRTSSGGSFDGDSMRPGGFGYNSPRQVGGRDSSDDLRPPIGTNYDKMDGDNRQRPGGSNDFYDQNGSRQSGSSNGRTTLNCENPPILGLIATGPQRETHCIPLSLDSDHKIINPGSLTVLVGTGGPRQTVYGAGKIDGPLRVIPSTQKIPGLSHQTIHSPSGGTIVLVGTGGPTQTVHHSGSHSDSGSESYEHDFHDQRRHDDNRGDQPGYLIPGYKKIDDRLPLTSDRDRIENIRSPGVSDSSYHRPSTTDEEKRSIGGSDFGSGTPWHSSTDRKNPENTRYDDRSRSNTSDDDRELTGGPANRDRSNSSGTGDGIKKTQDSINDMRTSGRFGNDLRHTGTREGDIGYTGGSTLSPENHHDRYSGNNHRYGNRTPEILNNDRSFREGSVDDPRFSKDNGRQNSGSVNGNGRYPESESNRFNPNDSDRNRGFRPASNEGDNYYPSGWSKNSNDRFPTSSHPNSVGDIDKQDGRRHKINRDNGRFESSTYDRNGGRYKSDGFPDKYNGGESRDYDEISRPKDGGYGDGRYNYGDRNLNQVDSNRERSNPRREYTGSDNDRHSDSYNNRGRPGSYDHYNSKPENDRRGFGSNRDRKDPLNHHNERYTPGGNQRDTLFDGEGDNYRTGLRDRDGYYSGDRYYPSGRDEDRYGYDNNRRGKFDNRNNDGFRPGGDDHSINHNDEKDQYRGDRRISGGDSSQEPNSSNTGNVSDIPSNIEDDSFSQAETSIKGGEVSATAQGTKNGGTAQTQVSGTYTGKGSFSATAQTSDKDRSAQAQISGGKEGAQTSAQGSGGKAKSQSQISVDSKTGGTSATSQSGGANHESQSEVVADEKGGLADAQASGPGHTSSQAQIGFKPKEDDSQETVYNVFNGGGTSSAQSNAKTGQSQAQINGKFKQFGVSYQGAAQAASGTKEEVKKIRDKSRSLFRDIELFGKKTKGKSETIKSEDGKKTKTSNTVMITSANPTISSSSDSIAPSVKPTEDYTDYGDEDDEEDEEDEDEDYNMTTSPPQYENRARKTLTTTESSVDISDINSEDDTTMRVITQKSPGQKQVAVIPNSEKNPVRLVQTQNGKIFKYPPEKANNLHFEPPEDAHDVTISKTTQKIKYKTRYMPSPNDNEGLGKKSLKDDSHVSITNSLSGKVDESGDGKFESTYITKTSKCGHVTFSCNVVYGSEGRSRICRPKQPNTKC